MKSHLVIILLFLPLYIKAQGTTEEINAQLKEKYNTETIYFFRNKNYSENEEKKIIKYLISFKYDENLKYRMATADLLYSLAMYSKNLNIQQEAVFQEIDIYWISYHFSEYRLYQKKMYTDKTIKRIIEIINGLNDKEMNIRLNDEIKQNIASNSYQDKINKLQEKTGMDRASCIDSVKKIIVEKFNIRYREELKNLACNPQYIKIIGWLYYKEYIPFLESLLIKDSFKEAKYQDAIKYALARMGVEKYTAELLKRKEFDFQYINTQESYWIFIEKNYLFDEYKSCLSDDTERKWPVSNSAENTLSIMTQCILNLPEGYQVKNACSTNENTIDEMKKKTKEALDWLKTNKGRYVLNDLKYINY